MTAKKLKPCPLCGGKSIQGSMFVMCSNDNCDMCGPDCDPTGAKWNEIARLVRLGREAHDLAVLRESFDIHGEAASVPNAANPEPPPVPPKPSLADLEDALRDVASAWIGSSLSALKPHLVTAADLMRTLRVEGAAWREHRAKHSVQAYHMQAAHAEAIFAKLGVPESAT